LAQDFLSKSRKAFGTTHALSISMPKRSSTAVACAAAGVVLFSQQAFVPGPKAHSRAQISAVAGSVAALGAAPAFADEIGEAAKRLSEASYPFLKEVNWNSYIYQTKPGDASAIDWVKAIDKAIVMGTAMDSGLLKRAVQAHIEAIKNVDANGIIPKADYEAINAAIGRIVASVPEDKVMDVYNSFNSVVPKGVPAYLMGQVNEDDAKKAYAAFMDFKDVVKAHPIVAAAPPAPIMSAAALGKIDAASKVMSTASYPFIKDVDWTSDIFIKPLPGAGPQQVLKAVNSALKMGMTMDPKLLKEAGEAHHKAILSIDANGVTTMADYTALNSATAKLVASTQGFQILEVFNAFAKLTGKDIPNNMYSLVKAGDAVVAYDAFWKFKDVVAQSMKLGVLG